MGKGIVTNHYKQVDEEEWMACSDYIKLDDHIPPNNISYYVLGDSVVANKLILSLNVHSPKHDGLAVAEFLGTAEQLYKAALSGTMPEALYSMIIKGASYEKKIGNRTIRFEKQSGENHRTGGYRLTMKILVEE